MSARSSGIGAWPFRIWSGSAPSGSATWRFVSAWGLMSIIDERGRLFGRLNVVDAAVVLLLIAIVPVGYGAYLLFRAPVPRLTDLAPNTFAQGPNLQTAVHGENLRPYMRVSFGDKQG